MKRTLKFSHKILMAAALIVIFGFCGFTVYSYVLQRNIITRDVGNFLNDRGEGTANSVQNWMSGRILLIESLSETLSRAGQEEQRLDALSQKSLLDHFMSVSIGERTGSILAQPAFEIPAGYDPRSRPWYIGAVQAGATTLSDPYQSAVTNDLVITIATPTADRNGNLLGVTAGDLSLDAVVNMINALDFNGSGYAFLINGKGQILVHPEKALVMKSLAEAYPGTSLHLSNELTEGQQDGKERLFTFIPVKGLPSVDWYIGLSFEKAKAYASLETFRTSAIFATAFTVVVIILLLGLLITGLMRPLHEMSQAMQAIADGDGDLTQRLTIRNQDEFGVLGAAFNRFVQRIHASITEVAAATGHVNQVTLRVIQASHTSINSSTHQAVRTSSVAAAINELGAAAQEIAQNASMASQHSGAARAFAQGGQTVVGQTIEAIAQLSDKISESCAHIESLNDKTVNIGRILEVITSISQQTNLLALNAAIEAARAGEAGRGFAVVADEVRNLAHRTQESAQQVHTMIEELQLGASASVSTMRDSQRRSDGSVAIANTAGERLGDVTQRIGEIDAMNHSVATATQEQTAVVETINVEIIEINALNQESVDGLQSTLRACAELEGQVARLRQMVGAFKI